MTSTGILMYWVGYFIVLLSFYAWNRHINRADIPMYDKEGQTVPVGIAVIVSLFSWGAIGLVSIFAFAGGLAYLLTATKLAKKVDILFSGKERK